MVQSPPAGTPLSQLVLFMVCLSVAGCIVAGGVFFTGNSPGQTAVRPPTNSYETGGIQIWSTPGNAYVDIQPLNGGMGYGGYTLPTGSYTLTDIPAYVTYRVTVSKDGYRPSTTTLYVQPHIIAETHPQLQVAAPDPGTLDIAITPYGGTVCIDGGQCETYPFDGSGELSRQVRDLAGDQYHTVTVSLNGYRPYSEDVWVPAGGDARIRATLQRW